MPGKGYPKDRVASTKYEHGSVSSMSGKPVSGSESHKPMRAGKHATGTGTTNPPKRAGK